MHRRKEGRLAADSDTTPSSFTSVSYSLIDRWGHLEEVALGVSSSNSVRGWKGGSFILVFCIISQKCRGMPSSLPPLRTEGQVGKMLSLLTKMYARSRVDDTWKPALGGYEACCIDWRPDKDRLLSHLHWAMRSEGQCSPVPLKKINFLLELHHHTKRKAMEIGWRQKTFPFVRSCGFSPVVIKEF